MITLSGSGLPMPAQVGWVVRTITPTLCKSVVLSTTSANRTDVYAWTD
jgi:hypothetical protein